MFATGQLVRYKNVEGFLDFVDTEYIGICARHCANRVHCVRVIVHPDQWDQVEVVDSSCSVHETSHDDVDGVLLEQLKETYGSQHRDQGQSSTVAGN